MIKKHLDLHLDPNASSVQSVAWEQEEVSSYPVSLHALIHCFIPDIT